MADKAAFGFGTPFAAQLEFFRQKLNLPTERWDDITRAAHDRAFIVAGAARADLLADLRGAVDKAIAQGTGLEAFRRDFAEIVGKRGWTGWTGEGSKAGTAWRTRVIYQTNMLTSYAAGRWKQLHEPGLLKARPYWQYHHADGVAHPRPLHLAWDGLTLPHDHPFWATHFPPNGWGCHCYISAARRDVFDAARLAGKAAPPAGWDAIDPKTGAQVGIDKGFDYAPGANAETALRQIVQDKLITYPPAISTALTHDINQYRKISAGISATAFAEAALENRQKISTLWLGFVEKPEKFAKATDVDLTGYTVLFPSEAVHHAEKHHQYDGGTQRPPIAADYEYLMDAITNPDETRAGDMVRGRQRILIWKQVGGEMYRWVMDVLSGKRNRSLSLVGLLVKTVKGQVTKN